MNAAASSAGVVGVVIDGNVTDVTGLRASKLPVWYRGRSHITTKKRGAGTVEQTIRCGGVIVRPGDFVLADEHDVYVAQPQNALLDAQEALVIQSNEPKILSRIQAGEKLAQIGSK